MHERVLVLTGVPGSGKSRMLDQFREKHPGVLQVIAPDIVGATLEPSLARWDSVDGVAIEDCLMWDIKTLQKAIAALEWQATARGKSLILVTQEFSDLSLADIRLRTSPSVVELSGHDEGLILSFDGGAIRFTDTAMVVDPLA